MSGGVKKALRAAGIAAAILLAGGIPLFFLFLLASLGLAPLYVTKSANPEYQSSFLKSSKNNSLKYSLP